MGKNGGSVVVNANDFYGVDVSGIDDYLKQIKAIALNDAKQKLKDTNTLFSVFRDGWIGKAEENFETNFNNAIEVVCKALDDAYDGLTSEIYQIGQGWIDQDAEMVQIQGGK